MTAHRIKIVPFRQGTSDYIICLIDQQRPLLVDFSLLTRTVAMPAEHDYQPFARMRGDHFANKSTTKRAINMERA